MIRVIRGRFTFLLAALLALAMFAPFIQDQLAARFLFDLLLCLVLLSAIWSVTGRTRVLMVALALLAFITSMALYLHETPVTAAVALGSDILFLFFATGAVLHLVLSDRDVTVDTIAGAIAAYFLLGIGWAYIYGAIEIFQPGSFKIPGDQDIDASLHIVSTLRHLLYHSFVTLTTLGYGDVTPLSQLARNFCVLEATAGQFYLGVLIARLVSIHTALSYRHRSDGE